MTEADGELLSVLPDRLRRLLAAAPVTEKKLLELSASWTGLPPDQTAAAELLRVFVVTWDPLEQLVPRPDGFATVNADPAGSELVVYVPVWSLLRSAAERDATVAAVLAAMAGAAVVSAAAHGLAVPWVHGADVAAPPAPDLLSDRLAGSALGTPEIGLVSANWESMGLGAITDIVQHAFGPVDLDRSIVELTMVVGSRPGCPACAGRRFGFPGELAEARAAMCLVHQNEAGDVIRTRLARANDSNPDGWGALNDAVGRQDLPHLPNGLATRLAGAGQAMYVLPEPEELAERARTVVEAASWFPGRQNDFAIALGEEPALAGQFPEWLVNLVLDLGRARLGAEAVMVGDALAEVAPDMRALFDGDIAVALAEAGLPIEARARVEANLTRWPDDFWIRMHAGDALAALGDLDAATAHFETALTMADDADDFEARADAIERLTEIGRLTGVGPRRPKQGGRGRPASRRKRGANRPGRKRKR